MRATMIAKTFDAITCRELARSPAAAREFADGGAAETGKSQRVIAPRRHHRAGHNRRSPGDEIFCSAWRRGWDYSALRASPLRGRPSGVIPALLLPRPSVAALREFASRLAEREGFEPSKGF